MFFLKSNSFNQHILRFRRLDASFWELHIKLLNSEGEPTWSQPEERVERRSTCRRQTAARPHKKSSSCRIYEGEWFLSGQSQSPVRPVLDQTPEEIQTVSVKYVQLFNHKVIKRTDFGDRVFLEPPEFHLLNDFFLIQDWELPWTFYTTTKSYRPSTENPISLGASW